MKNKKKLPETVKPVVEHQKVTQRKYEYIGIADHIKIGNLVVHTATITDAEIDMFLKNYPKLKDYFKLLKNQNQ